MLEILSKPNNKMALNIITFDEIWKLCARKLQIIYIIYQETFKKMFMSILCGLVIPQFATVQ